MPSAATMAVFAGASLALLVLPGPAVVFIVARSSTQGRRAGLVSVAGIHAATAVHVLAAVIGLCSDNMYALAAASLGTRLQQRHGTRRTGKVVEGTSLIGLGLASLAFPSHATR